MAVLFRLGFGLLLCPAADIADKAAVVSLPGQGTEEQPYLIGSTDDWTEFCNILNSSSKGVFDGKFVKPDADVSVTEMAGSANHDFTGTFDGGEHTLTFNFTADSEYTAPFRMWKTAV